MAVETLDIMLKRQREVFNHFINFHGREVSLLPLLKKYAKQDGVEKYEFEKLVEYLELFINSNLITPAQLNAYNNTKKVSIDLVKNRGREVLEAFISSRGSWELVEPLTKKYEEEDGKLTPYTRRVLNKYRNYYIEHNIDPELIHQYNIVMELAKRPSTDGYDIELLNSILKLSDEDAVKFIKKIEISRTSLFALRNVYGTVYPANKDELKRIDDIINESYKRSNVSTGYKLPEDSPKRVINKLKLLLEQYLVRDTHQISTLFQEFGMTNYSFKEALKEALQTDDKILMNLLDQYNIKETTILANKKEVLDIIIDARTNGVNYGNGYRQFNLFDLNMLTYYTIDELIEGAYRLYSPAVIQELKKYLRKLSESRVYETAEELFNGVNFGTNGRLLEDDEKELIISYMTEMNWPYSAKLFQATARRYLDGDLVIELLEENNDIVNKM